MLAATYTDTEGLIWLDDKRAKVRGRRIPVGTLTGTFDILLAFPSHDRLMGIRMSC